VAQRRGLPSTATLSRGGHENTVQGTIAANTALFVTLLAGRKMDAMLRQTSPLSTGCAVYSSGMALNWKWAQLTHPARRSL